MAQIKNTALTNPVVCISAFRHSANFQPSLKKTRSFSHFQHNFARNCLNQLFRSYPSDTQTFGFQISEIRVESERVNCSFGQNSTLLTHTLSSHVKKEAVVVKEGWQRGFYMWLKDQIWARNGDKTHTHRLFFSAKTPHIHPSQPESSHHHIEQALTPRDCEWAISF